MFDQESLDTNPNEKFYLIKGIYHPTPQNTDSIEPCQRWDVLDHESLKSINDQLVGKPILVDHPFDRAGNPLLSGEYGSNYRGRIIHSEILEDGRGFFVGKIPVNKTIKSRLFKSMLKDGRFVELSLTHQFFGDPTTGKGRFVPDHIALLKRDEARRPGCEILEILKMPKKSRGDFKSNGEINNLFQELKKNNFERKNKRFLSIASKYKMSAEQPVTNQQPSSEPASSNLKDDAPSNDPLVDDASLAVNSEIINEITNNESEFPRDVLAQTAVIKTQEVDALKKQLAEQQKQIDEYKKTQNEIRMKQVNQKLESTAKPFIEMANVEIDPSAPPTTAEAKQKNSEQITKKIDYIASIRETDPITQKEKLLEGLDQLTSLISVASKDGADKVTSLTNMIRNGQSRKHELPISSWASRFAAKKQKTIGFDKPAESSSPSSSEAPSELSILDQIKRPQSFSIRRDGPDMFSLKRKEEELLRITQNMQEASKPRQMMTFAPRKKI